MSRPRMASVGSTRSNAARLPPAKIAIFPVAARWQPPETGQSIAVAPSASTFAARRRTSALSVVLISSQIFPAPSHASRPWAGSMTSAEAAGDGRQVMTMSTDPASSRGDAPRFAPRETNESTSASFRSRTVRSTPWRNRLPASLLPTLPRPMKPIRVSVTKAPPGLSRPAGAPLAQRLATWQGPKQAKNIAGPERTVGQAGWPERAAGGFAGAGAQVCVQLRTSFVLNKKARIHDHDQLRAGHFAGTGLDQSVLGRP